MPRQADPIRFPPLMGTYQDPIGVRYFFNDGEVVEAYGNTRGMSLFYEWYADQHQPFTHADSLAMYERAKQCVSREDILGDPYEYSPGYSRVVRR